MTVLLLYEHYDGFHEFAPRFLPLKHIVTDNTRFCFNNHPNTDAPAQLKLPDSPELHLKKGTRWYSVVWLRNESLAALPIANSDWSSEAYTEDYAQPASGLAPLNGASSLAQRLGNLIFFTAYDEKRHSGNFEPPNELGVPRQPFTAQLRPSALANDYHHVLLEGGKELPESEVFNTPKLQKNLEYYFVGSSHMRYLFDAVVGYALNSSAVAMYERKHTSLDLGPFHYRDRLVAEQIHHAVMDLCYSSVSDKVVVIQFGAWDLTHSSIRRALMDVDRGADTLIRGLSDLFNARSHCPGLIHLVFMTTPPYPICNTKSEPGCEQYRRYRNPSTLLALMQRFLEAVIAFEMKPGNEFKFSIIDSYNILKSRLAFSENSETACGNHYMCTVSEHDITYNILSLTPGGLAILKAVIHAIFT